MRVLFVAHSFPRAPDDAAGSFILRLARALVARGVAVAAVVPHAPGLPLYDSFDGVALHRYRYAPERYETLAYTGTMAEQVRAGAPAKLALAGLVAAGARAAVARARAWRADLVHAHWWFPGGLAGAAAHRVLGVPLVTTAHGSDVRLVDAMPGGRALLRGVVRQSAQLTAVSSWLASQLEAASPGARPVVAPMPADVDRFAGREPGSPRAGLLFVGRLNEQKGVASLLRALAASRTGATLDVVGDGPDAAALRALAAELGVASRVRWHGAQPPVALPAFYQRAAAVVVPSVGEGLGLVAVEAQLSATPVVAFASGGLLDVVRDGRTGVLVPPGDAPGLAAALDRVVGDPEHARVLGEAGRASALAAFSPAVAAARYATIYDAAVATQRT